MAIGYAFGILGAGLMLIGVFLPLASAPLWGSINLWQLDHLLALVVMLIAAAHIAFCVRQIPRGVRITKAMTAIVLMWGVIANWRVIIGHRPLISAVLNPVVKIQFGVSVLTIGILILLVAPLPEPQPPASAPPKTGSVS
jgi:hypothetical protein